MTEEERACVAQRTSEVIAKIQGEGGVKQSLVDYCKENGYDEETAVRLVEETIIPGVDRYNQGCREAMDIGVHECVRQKIKARLEGMELSQEYAFKLAVIQALRGMDKTVLERAALLGEDEYQQQLDEINEQAPEIPEDVEVTQEMMDEVNEELEAVIESSSLSVHLVKEFEKFVDGNPDEMEISVFVTDLWKDERYKYCASTAICVARHNGELPSIPEGISDEILVLNICQEVDVENIESEVAEGNLSEDRAFQLLKIIAAVGLTIFTAYIAYKACVVAGAVSFAFAKVIIGSGVVGILAGSLLLAGIGTAIAIAIKKAYVPIGQALGRVADFTYGALKKGAAKISQFVNEKALPAIFSGIERVKQYFVGCVERFKTHRKKNVKRLQISH